MKEALEKTKISSDDADIAPKIFGFAALGVMAATFALMQFPMTVIIFLVLVGYFVWRAVSRTEMNEIRGVFEFYLAANEILRDDERRWYGFEIQEVISRGERIMSMMPDPPPLVHYTLGALYSYAGNPTRAEEHLALLLENERTNEKSQLSASSELKSYVRILRKLEREPAEAPQTMAAIRALERSRRNRAASLLEESRRKLKELAAAAPPKELPAEQPQKRPEPFKPLLERLAENHVHEQQPNIPPLATFKSPISDVERQAKPSENIHITNGAPKASVTEERAEKPAPTKNVKPRTGAKPAERHRPISEVLRDIYD